MPDYLMFSFNCCNTWRFIILSCPLLFGLLANDMLEAAGISRTVHKYHMRIAAFLPWLYVNL